MKKSLLALAALTAFAGAASAQSSVTLFGVVDVSARYTEYDDKGQYQLATDGNASSRLGFRGVEDLGGGLKAGFWLEGSLSADTGTMPLASINGGSGNSAAIFQRRATVSLMGGWGEIRLGRDYTTHFWNTTVYDPFGTNGVGSANTFAMLGAANANVSTAVRSNNAISYFTPNLGGFSAQLQYAFGEQVSGGVKTNNFMGFRLGYAAGPISVHGAYGKTEGATDAVDHKAMNFGGSFDMGFLKASLMVAQEKNGAGLKTIAIEPGIMVPVGAGVIRASFARHDQKGGTAAWNDNDWDKIAVGYLHNLSKRTTVYATYARIANDGTQTKTVANNGLGGVTASPGGNSSGIEFGVRHAF